jgi:hypothetical protein
MGTSSKQLCDNKLAKTNRSGSRKNAKGAIQKSDGGTWRACFPTDSKTPVGVTNPDYHVRSSHRFSLNRIKTFASTGHGHE